MTINEDEAKRQLNLFVNALNEFRKCGKSSKDAEKCLKLAKSFMSYGLYNKAFKFAVKGRIILAKEMAS